MYKSYLERIKKYSKCNDTAIYSKTSNINDVYETLKFQNILYFELTDLSTTSIKIKDIEFFKGHIYNILKYFDNSILTNPEFIQYINNGFIKITSKLTEDFQYLQPQHINLYLDKIFDYMTIKVVKLDQSGFVDTRLSVIESFNNTPIIKNYTQSTDPSNNLLDNNEVGYYRADSIYNNTNLLLSWDNGLYTINFKNIYNFTNLQNVKINVESLYYDDLNTGMINFEITTYKDDTIIQQFYIHRNISTVSQDPYHIGEFMFNINYNVATQNAILSNQNDNFNTLLDSVNFNDFQWNMGTSGLPLLIPDTTLTTKPFSQDNYYSVEQIFNELNYTTVDYASNDNIDITGIYDILTIDGYVMIDNNTILLKNQTNIEENGIYTYINKSLIYNSFYNIIFIKYGVINKDTEYHLDISEDGLSYTKTYLKGDSYVLRNKLRYNLLNNHNFNDSRYVKNIIDNNQIDFTYRYFTIGGYYKVSDDFLALEYYTNEILSAIFRTNTLLQRIENLHLIRNGNELVYFNNGIFESKKVFDINIIDFVYNDNFYLLDNDSKVYKLDNDYNIIDTKQLINASEIRYEDGIIYVSGNDIRYYYNEKDYVLCSEDNKITQLKNNSLNISYIVNNFPKSYQVDKNKFQNLLNYDLTEKVKIPYFSKTKLGDFEIIDNRLYIKGIEINSNNELPKINNYDYWLFQGGYAIADLSLDETFTIEFMIYPKDMILNETVFCIGNEHNLISFHTNNTNGFPYFKYNDNYVLSNKKILEQLQVSITYNGNLLSIYFDGVIVGNMYMNITLSNIIYKYIAKYKDDSYVNYHGGLSNLKIWNIALNSQQIRTYRNFESHLNMTYFWRLDNSFNNVENITFYNTLNDQMIDIYDVKQIQLSDTDLYILSERPIVEYNDFSQWEVEDRIVDYDDSLCVRLTSPLYSEVSTNIYVQRGNKISISCDVYSLSNSSIIIESPYFANIVTNSTLSNQWETLTIEIDIPENINEHIEVNFITVKLITDDRSYFRNYVSYTDKTFYPDTFLFKLNLLSEKIEIYRKDTDYYNNTLGIYQNVNINAISYNNAIYYTHQYALFREYDYLISVDANKYITIYNNICYSVVYLSPPNPIYSIIGVDITTDQPLFRFSQSIDFFGDVYADDYGIFWKNDEILNVFSYNSGFIGYYKEKDNSVIGLDYTAYIQNNIVYYNNNILDIDSRYYRYDLKNIVGIYDINNELIIVVNTTNNETHIWKYNGIFKRYADSNTNHRFIYNATSFRHFDNYFILTDKTSITYFIIDDMNFNISKTPLNLVISDNIIDNYTINTTYRISNIPHTINNDSNIIVEKIDNDYYISRMYANNYELMNNISNYDIEHFGVVVGDNGLKFHNNGNLLEYQNMDIRADFKSLDISKISIDNDKGYIFNNYTENTYIVGKNGLFMKDDKVFKTNTYSHLNSVSFYDDNNGLIVGDNIILYTNNGGDYLTEIVLDTYHIWNKVLYYDFNKAYVIGSDGIILSLFYDKEWTYTKIEFNNLYTQSVNDIVHIDSKFYIVGNSGLFLMLENDNIKQIPTNNEDWKQISYYKDNILNETIIYLLSNNNVYQYLYNDLTLILSQPNINTISVSDTYHVYGNKLYNSDNQSFDDIFKPRMLFLDYFIGRKINAIVDGDYLKPITYLPKDLLSCYRFDVGDYILFSDEHNYLSYQDFNLNRHVLDVPNSNGQIQYPLFKYNKKIMVGNYEHYEFTDYEFKNESITDLNNYQIGDIRHDSKITKLVINNLPCDTTDVVNLTLTNNNEIIGKSLYISLDVESIQLYDIVDVIDNGNEYMINIFGYIEYFSKNTTITELINYFKSKESKLLPYINNELSKRCIRPKEIMTNIESNNIIIDGLNINLDDIVTNAYTYNAFTFSKLNNQNYLVYYKNGIFKYKYLYFYKPTSITYNEHFNMLYLTGSQYSNDIIHFNLDTEIFDFSNNDVIYINNTSKYSIVNKTNNALYVAYPYSTGQSGFQIILNNQLMYNMELNFIPYGSIFIDKLYTLSNINMFLITTDNNTNTWSSANIINDYVYTQFNLKPFIEKYNDILIITDIENNILFYKNSLLIHTIENINVTNVFKVIDDKLYISSNDTLYIINLINYNIKTILFDSNINSMVYKDVIYISLDNSKIEILDYNTEILYNTDFTLNKANVKLFNFQDMILEASVGNNLYNISYNEIFPTDIAINIKNVVYNNINIIKNKVNDVYELDKYYNDEMVLEMNKTDNIYFHNLGIFNGDILNLKNIFDKHLLSESYDMIINKEDYIIIQGNVNDNTKYFNLEGIVNYKNQNFNIETNNIYSMKYNILDFLNNINPIFDENYLFDMPDNTYTLSSNFYVEKNKIITNLIHDYREGMIIDIISPNKTIKAYIKDIIDNNIVFDREIETKINLVSTIRLRGRNSLGEISKDLEFTDNIQIPIDDLYLNQYYKHNIVSKYYSSVFLKDENILNNVSSIVYINDKDDLQINIIDYKKDPNIVYYPIELFEIGCDEILKKSISVNYYDMIFNNNWLALNVDLNNYNYRLVDNLTVKVLESDYFWMLNNDIRNAIIGQVDGKLVWYQGDFLCGEWVDGIWHTGTAYDINWLNGTVTGNNVEDNYNIISLNDTIDINNNKFYRCNWYGGIFNGIMYNCNWYHGNFNGEWKTGILYNGDINGNINGGLFLNANVYNASFQQLNNSIIWENGNWYRGDFNGYWKNGYFTEVDGISRFGNLSNKDYPSIWEYGCFDGGTIYDENTIIYNIYMKNGSINNGTVKYINSIGGIIDGAYIKSDLIIESIKQRVEYNTQRVNIEIKFTDKHFFKYRNDTHNYITILGEPNIINGNIQFNAEILGYNQKPIKHDVIEIIDEYTVLIAIDDINFPYTMFNNIIYDEYFNNYNFFIGDIQHIFYDNYFYISLDNNIIQFNPSQPDDEKNIINIQNPTNMVKIHHHNSIDYFTLVGDRVNRLCLQTIYSGDQSASGTFNLPFTPVKFMVSDNYLIVWNVWNVSNSITIINPWQTQTQNTYSIPSPTGTIKDMVVYNNEVYIGFSNTTFIRKFNIATLTYTTININGFTLQLIVNNNNVSVITSNGIEIITDNYVDNIQNINFMKNNYILCNGAVYLYDSNTITEIINGYDYKDYIYSSYYELYFFITENSILLYDDMFVFKDELIINKNLIQIIIDDSNRYVYVQDDMGYLICITDDKNIFVCEECSDYTIEQFEYVNNKTLLFDIEYVDKMKISSNLDKCKIKSGIIDYVYLTNSTFDNGMWIDGVSENSTFGL